jgi:CRP-like cAMP-binding protein
MAKKRTNTDERLRSIPLFRELSKQELKRVSSLMTPINVPNGQQLITEGAHGREFMIILDGTAVVRRRGRKIADLGPGDFLGEVAVIANTPRTADVIATSDMTIEVLTSNELAALLDDNAGMMKKILMGAVARLAELERSKTA